LLTPFNSHCRLSESLHRKRAGSEPDPNLAPKPKCAYRKSPPTRQWKKEWRTKISFGRTVMQTLELLQLAKRHISG